MGKEAKKGNAHISCSVESTRRFRARFHAFHALLKLEFMFSSYARTFDSSLTSTIMMITEEPMHT